MCPFCRIGAGDPERQIIEDLGDVIVFEPRGPVIDGHRLIVPRVHVEDAAEDPHVTARTFEVAARLAQAGPCNLVTNVGAEAGQSVFHLHVHIVPRTTGDGLKPIYRRTDQRWPFDPV